VKAKKEMKQQKSSDSAEHKPTVDFAEAEKAAATK
jgi:hypothetical protein